MPNNIIDKIRVSGVTYDIGGQGSGVSVVEVTQAEYDALPSSAKTDASKMYVITDAEAGDLTQYWTSAQTQSAITQAVSGKQDTLVSGTNIKTINNENILGSGNITIQGGGNPTVELTQAQYDALVTAGTVSSNTYYIITDAEAGDLTNYYTKTEVDNAITAATATKQDTLVSGTNIKTINNISILGSGNIDVQGGGGGKAVSGGTNISITTGETADTINCTLPITATTYGDPKNIILGSSNSVPDRYNTSASIVFGRMSKVKSYDSLVGGYKCENEKGQSQTFGNCTKTKNQCEFASGQYNTSNKANTTFGDSGNTLFSVGNGTAENARHNAFEIRQNGDIYLTSGGTDIKLQDYLGGGGSSINVVQTTGSSTTDVMSQAAVTDIIGDIETLLSNI